MFLELLGEGDVIEVVEAVNRVPKGVVVFLLDQKGVVSIVDSFDVQLGQKSVGCPQGPGFTYVLHGDEVRTNKRDVIHLAEHSDHTGVINTRNQHTQKIGQQGWLLLEVERQGLVVTS